MRSGVVAISVVISQIVQIGSVPFFAAKTPKRQGRLRRSERSFAGRSFQGMGHDSKADSRRTRSRLRGRRSSGSRYLAPVLAAFHWADCEGGM